MNRDMHEKLSLAEIASHTSEVVAAYVTSHELDTKELQQLIIDTFQTFTHLKDTNKSAQLAQAPAVPIEESVRNDYIICLEDGRHLKMLKRHLKSAFNMTPEQYRQRWNLPADYPMIAPDYAKRRSILAKDIGLGTTGRRKRSAYNQNLTNKAA